MLLAIATALSVLAPPVRPARAPRPLALSYEIRWANDSLPGLDVRLSLAANGDSVTTFQLPSEWAGRRELYRNIEGLTAEGSHARIEQGSSPDQLLVHHDRAGRYSLHWHLRGAAAPSFSSDSHNHSDITPDWAQLVGYDAFIVPDLPEDRLVDATFLFPRAPDDAATQRVIATSYGSARGSGSIRARVPAHSLWHALYVISASNSAIRLYQEHVNGRTVHMAIRDSLAIPDTALSRVLRGVISMERHFWNDPGPADYVVSIGAASRGTTAGTRLVGAFVAEIDPTLPLNSRVVELFSHELMHEWLGGAIHPIGGLADGQLSWFTEGFTDFLNHRLLWQSGLLSDSGYVARVNSLLAEHAMSPAANASWKDIVAGYWTTQDIKREPYLRGELLALRLSALAPPGRFEALLQSLQVAARKGFVLTDSTIGRTLESLYGAEAARREVAVTIDSGRVTLPASLFGSCATTSIADLQPWDPGFDIDATLKAKSMRGVRIDGPAARAGLADGMATGRISIYRGDVTHDISLQARVDSATMRQFAYRPVGDRTVPAQAFALPQGCRVSVH
ncbi:MAG: hypothetical protein JWO05_3556 [Gemmatimonadetes bacterium]|nr:hypothetical protein [Gemmatimonadota bacterium]